MMNVLNLTSPAIQGLLGEYFWSNHSPVYTEVEATIMEEFEYW